VPLTVRRKLDIAQLKISLEGWQKLSRAERLALCHLPVDTAAELDIYREVMRGFCDRCGVTLKPLQDPQADARAWNCDHVPAEVVDKAQAPRLTDARWRELDEEARYALLKLSDPKKNPEKLQAALVELGLKVGPAPEVSPSAAVCDSPGRLKSL
jgi:hypothetical protein